MNDLIKQMNDNPGLIAIVSSVSALFGVLLGWGLNQISDRMKYKRRRRDDEEKERKERFKHKGEFAVSDGTNISDERLYNVRTVDAVFCSYEASLDGDCKVQVSFPKGISNSSTLKHQFFYLENVGEARVYEMEIAVECPKNNALIKKSCIDEYVKRGIISYGVSFDNSISSGEVVAVKVYYYEDDPIVSLFSASLLLFYRDSYGNVCEQPLFPEQNKIYEPTLINYRDWREHVSVKTNLGCWNDRLREKNK